MTQYLNSVAKHAHRAIERIVRLMLEFKSRRCAHIISGDIELKRMKEKQEMKSDGARHCRLPTDSPTS